MPVECVNEPEYRVVGEPGLEGLTFTSSSKGHLTWPQAVEFCKARKSVLQSLREAVGFRCHAKGLDSADWHQTTRTTAVCFVDAGKRYVAIDDSPDPEENIILARAEEAYRACLSYDGWSLPLDDTHVKGILARAEKGGRIAPTPDRTYWRLRDEYVSQPLIRAMFGDMAQAFATRLSSMGYDHSSGDAPTPKTEGVAIVRAVGIGVDSYNTHNRFGAIQKYGLARGVHGSISSG